MRSRRMQRQGLVISTSDVTVTNQPSYYKTYISCMRLFQNDLLKCIF